ncbi:glycoside hydrolase domain-containing protein [Nocardioides marmoriginsengisoli]|nr:glycoside hydrolase domain-containing protein [Nocardioides marmoriginsengisoli]
MSALPRLATALRHSLVTTLVVGLVAVVAITVTTSSARLTASTTANPITPGNFTGYGFDQCEAPSQAAMTAWRKSSPFRAAGIYISGSLRFCQKQTNLTPTWVRTQLAAGWRLLPIHLGAQASCTTRDRYQKNRISADPADTYAKARSQGRAEARIAVAAAQRLGIVPRSTLYYDLEAFNPKIASCKASSLWFLGAWTNQIHQLGYVSGVYSSAASGMKILDDARVTPGNKVALPDQIWIADWNDKADTNSTYIRSDGWPGARIHQYQGGHNEKWGGVTINIDRNYLDLRGQASTPPPISTPEGSKLYDAKCTTASINRWTYRYATPTRRPGMVVPLQCLLKQRGLYTWPVTGKWNSMTTKAVASWQKRVKHPVRKGFTRADWVSLLSAGNSGTTLKPGVRGADVIRAQRTLNAGGPGLIKITGIYDASTQKAARAYQIANGIKPTEGIIAKVTWGAFSKGTW